MLNSRRTAWLAACLLVAAAGCLTHPSKDNPSLWGDSSVFMDPVVFTAGATGAKTRDVIHGLLKENDLEIRWSNTTALDGEYVFQSARELKMKITYQAIGLDTTRITIYRTTTDQTLQTLLKDAITQRLDAAPPDTH